MIIDSKHFLSVIIYAWIKNYDYHELHNACHDSCIPIFMIIMIISFVGNGILPSGKFTVWPDNNPFLVVSLIFQTLFCQSLC